MFTGIIQDVGRCRGLRSRGPGRVLEVATGLDTVDFALGESIAVNGACLTVVAIEDGCFGADVSPETLLRTSLGGLKPGAAVNLERALRPVDRLGGHFVLGHVDGLGRLTGRRAQGEFQVLTFSVPAELSRYLVAKGSVAVDGVSLTVSGLVPEGFSVAAVPHTLERTTLSGLAPGSPVNLETDVLGRYVERLLGRGDAPEGVTMELLARSGFLR